MLARGRDVSQYVIEKPYNFTGIRFALSHHGTQRTASLELNSILNAYNFLYAKIFIVVVKERVLHFYWIFIIHQPNEEKEIPFSLLYTKVELNASISL